MNIKFYFILPIIFTVFVTSAFADEQVPGMVASVTADPFYFSEGGFGIIFWEGVEFKELI